MNSLFLAYAGPPLLGAFIGYLTNRVAIRMLFRPLSRWRVLGIPVPMTPGVIPSRRHELAKNIGEMVGTHLLTSKDIGSALSEEKFQDNLHTLVDERIDALLGRDFGPVRTLVPKRFQTYFKVAVRTLKYRFRTGVHRYMESDDFAARVTQTMREQLDSFGLKPLNEMVSREERRAFYTFIDTLIADLLAGPATEERLAGYLRENLRQAADNGKTLGEYVPATLHDFIIESIQRYSPAILRQLAGMLAEPPVRDRIISAVRGGIDDFISSLGPLGSLAGGFLDMKALEKSIRGYLTDKEGDIRSWLENPEVQERFSVVLVDLVDRYLDKPLAELVEHMEEEKLAAVCRGTAEQLLGIVRSPGVIEAMATMLRENLEEMIGNGERTVSESASRLLGQEAADNLQGMAAAETVALIRSPRSRALLDKMMNTMFDSALNRPIGILNNILPATIRTGFTDYAVLTVNRIMLQEVPRLVDSLEIRRIVTAKVDSLDLLRLEKLLLSIMEEQFKYINLFGGLLGFLIGLANLLFLQMR
ncbi:MAG: DUF445 family protein [Desulfobulbaceae bacterium]|nr:DUF445 family protein [Desulfobulbaceae bacterium]